MMNFVLLIFIFLLLIKIEDPDCVSSTPRYTASEEGVVFSRIFSLPYPLYKLFLDQNSSLSFLKSTVYGIFKTLP